MANETTPSENTVNGSIHSAAEKEKDQTNKESFIPSERVDDFPHGIKLALLIVALCLSVFLVALDNTIIATAIPRITDEFKSLDDISWYGSAYLLATAATQLLFGKFYSFLPIKWVYITAITIFEIGSAVCGAAPTSNALIGGRAIAGFGSAGIFTGALIIIGKLKSLHNIFVAEPSSAHAVPLSKRPMYTGLIGAMYGLASVVGPLMGGAFTDKVTWRWCFYINLPIGAVTLFVMVFLFKMPHSADREPVEMSLWERIEKFDPFGTVVFIPAIVSLLLALQWGGSKYEWSNGRIIGLFVVFGVLIICFIAVQLWKGDNATVPPRVFKQRSIWSGAFFSLCLGAAFFILVFYLPIWFQAIKGTSAVKSGISSLPMILSLVVGSLIAGSVVTVTGYYTPWLLVSTVLMSVGSGLLYTLRVNTGHSKWIGYQVLYGLGVGVGMQQPVIAAQTVLPLKDVPVGTSILMFLQTLGGALFISAGTNVFTNRLVSGLIRANIPGVSPRYRRAGWRHKLEEAH
ncbi:DHA14-like major facilitator [Mycena indigotica]|uniref:DHA14-like major facilitator n=1 Tax=Mycena indigotica TaxID=2126181 RepID=A0A8H6T6X4_9AGAR|nr:DHA14-like major facilitator [Mycena indigotica]KAF7312051.1 DHA14-like major facilitator [Mycena indigotica]